MGDKRPGELRGKSNILGISCFGHLPQPLGCSSELLELNIRLSTTAVQALAHPHALYTAPQPAFAYAGDTHQNHPNIGRGVYKRREIFSGGARGGHASRRHKVLYSYIYQYPAQTLPLKDTKKLGLLVVLLQGNFNMLSKTSGLLNIQRSGELYMYVSKTKVCEMSKGLETIPGLRLSNSCEARGEKFAQIY